MCKKIWLIENKQLPQQLQIKVMRRVALKSKIDCDEVVYNDIQQILYYLNMFGNLTNDPDLTEVAVSTGIESANNSDKSLCQYRFSASLSFRLWSVQAFY